MLNSTNNVMRGNATISSEIPSLSQCLALEPITLENSKHTRVELRKVLGVPPGSISEDHSFGVLHPKPPPSVATEELKHFKDSVKDASRKARDRAKMLRDNISKLEKYREALNSKKRQRNDLSVNERSNVAKVSSHIPRSHHDIMNQRLEDRAKSAGLNKRVRTSVADVRTDGRSATASRQQIVVEKGGDTLQDVGGGAARCEEKIRRLPAGAEGWDNKNKKKRSVGIVGSRVANADRDLKRAMQSKMNGESKLRCSESQGLRSKSSPGLPGTSKLGGSLEPTSSDNSMVSRDEMETDHPRDRMPVMEQRVVTKVNNKPNIHDETLATSPNTVIKAKVSRAPRTGSIMLLDSSLKVQNASTSMQGLEQPTSSNKVQVSGGGSNHKRQVSTGSSSHAMAQWVGQRPHKNSRTRRANIISPVPNPVESQIPSQGVPTSDFSARTSIGNNGSLVGSSIDNNIPKFKRETENVSSPFAFSESEESGAGEYRFKDKRTESGEVALPPSQKGGAFVLPSKKNKLPTNEVGDGVRRQGRSGRSSSVTRPAIHPVREKLENVPMTKPLQSVKPAFDKNKSKTGRPPSKKLKDRKGIARVGPMLNSNSIDFTGESDDDREELFIAANSARNASNGACNGPFWKQMESYFNSVNSEDISYLKQQLSIAEQLNESLSQMLGVDYNVLGVLMHKEVPDYSVERQTDETNQESTKKGSLCGRVDVGAPLYQRVLSALIEEDESEEIYIHGEGKNMSFHYASDDSHCGSCNLIDVEPKDRDRMESEVESKVDFQSQKSCFLDILSCDKSVGSNTLRNSSMSSSLHSNGQWQGEDDFSHSSVGHASEICSNDLGQFQMRELSMSGFCSSDRQYQSMCLDERVLLELQSIGLCLETLPDLAEGEEVMNRNIMELNEGLQEQIERKQKKLGKIDKAVEKGRDAERRNMEQVAMDQLVEMAYRKRLACRGNNNSKGPVRKVSKQAALAFIKRTLTRCRKFESIGSSCFSEPALQEIIFSTPQGNNDAKSADCVGSGTASNTCNEVSNHHIEARGSGTVSSTFEKCDFQSDSFDRGKKREALIDDVIGSASSRVTSTFDSNILGLKGKRTDRDQNKDNLRSNSISGASRSSIDGLKGERKIKSKPKQKSTHLLTSGTHGVNASNKLDREHGPVSLSNIPQDACKEEEPLDFSKLEFDEIGIEMSTDLGGNQDLDSWFNLDEDALQGHDSIGLEIPMDDLSDLNMLM